MATKITQLRRVGIRAARPKSAGAGWTVRACAVLVLALVLAAVGVGPAVADELEAPTVVPSSGPETGSLPGWIIVRWGHSGQGLNEFSVERENPYFRWDNVNAAQRNLPDGGLRPDTTYRYRVCAYFNTEDGEPACSEWQAGKTSPPGSTQQQQRPPRPRIVEHHAGHTWVGIKWEAGYDYDSYFINITGPFGTAKGPRELRTIHHDDDGTWGYQRVDGLLPGRAYGFSVQGCTETIFGLGDDRCWDWAPEYPAYTSSYPLHSGPDTLRTALRLAGCVRGRPDLRRGEPPPAGRRRQRTGAVASCLHVHSAQLHLHRTRHLQGPLRLARGAARRPRLRHGAGTLAGGG